MVSQQELREQCQDLHKQAEETKLAQALVKGSVPARVYKQMIWQLYQIADVIERKWRFEVSDLDRRQKLALDVAQCAQGDVSTLASTSAYCAELNNLTPDQLRGHVYVHYMGWLYGGQMLKKNLKFPINHLEFQDVKSCVDYIRSRVLVDLTDADSLAAQRAFQSIMEIYNELY
jgi:heme oxygenase